MEITINQKLNQAITAHQEGRLEEAEKLYREILEIQPNSLDANNNLGVLLQYYNKFEEAEKLYKKAIELKPDYAEAYSNLSVILNKLNKFDEAIVSCQKAIEFNPSLAQAYSNLGNAFFKLNRHEDAIVNYNKAIELKPNYIKAHNDLGVSLQIIGKIDEAERAFKKVIELKPDNPETHNNLGSILIDLDRLDEAEKYFTKAIELKRDFKEALTNRGQLLFDRKDFELALKDFDTCNTEVSRSRALASLFALGRTKEIYQRIEKHSELDNKNIRVAAFSSFISNKEKKNTAHKFCNNPMDFIYTSNLSAHIENSNLFIVDLIKELKNIKTRWEPYSKSTKQGLQSFENLFKDSPEKIKKLKLIIFEELDLYYSKFKDETCSFIKEWPSEKHLHAWHVILKQQGFQTPHIHAGGWLSGVVYLKVVPHLGKNEGAIELSLNGELFSDSNSPKLIHEPDAGDIILFPSSLHHRTIPFTSNEDRISIAFDLMPTKKN